MYGKPDRAEDCGAMDPVCRGGGNSHLASHLDVKIVWHQRSINQARKKMSSAALGQRLERAVVRVQKYRSSQRDRPAPLPPEAASPQKKLTYFFRSAKTRGTRQMIALALSSEKRDSARALWLSGVHVAAYGGAAGDSRSIQEAWRAAFV